MDSSTTIRTIRTPADLLIMSLEMPARSEVTFAAMQCKWVQVNIANIYNGVNPSFNCLLKQKHKSVNAEMINKIRLRLKLENLLTCLRSKCGTRQVISLSSLKSVDALSKQETDWGSQKLCVKANGSLTALPHQKGLYFSLNSAEWATDHHLSFHCHRHNVPQPLDGVGSGRKVRASKGFNIWREVQRKEIST